MLSPVLSTVNDFYLACCKNDLEKVQQTVNRSEIDTIGPVGNTALHIASMRNYVKLVRLLLRYHASRTIRNDEGYTAEELATTEEIKAAFNTPVRTISDFKHFVASSREIEWLDSYKNAYRISYENHEHMKRWLTKVPLQKLLDAICNEYVDQMNFKDESHRETIKTYLSYAAELEDPLGLLQAYTTPKVQFHYLLNHDLAELGSDFRFVSSHALIKSGYADNEPPKDIGQYIFASLVINHPRFRSYFCAGITFRGMKITRKDLEEYNRGNIIMTRSFLSTSKNRSIAELFLDCECDATHPPVICIYKVINSRSSLSIETISQIPDEEEVLIVPFTVFQIKDQRVVQVIQKGSICPVTEIELEECSSA
ncbi:unnamed protein product [Adineta steineri]|uniref:NAD(P)(+)--arginine ADP-ribosyltransferase n=1 Tax=Adineta steineri TaxID=433720 RepID=A0A814ERB2_9BILA|nr:unnamed protein product [Adineta steineri]CAF0972673.1 unnamed protein product [Adineta steineri]